MRSACCACVASGHAAATPPTSVINSRRLIGFPKPEDVTLAYAVGAVLHHSKSARSTSGMGHQRTFHDVCGTSASPPKADIRRQPFDVGFGPTGDIAATACCFHHLRELAGASWPFFFGYPFWWCPNSEPSV
jgi:hypothetical protein